MRQFKLIRVAYTGEGTFGVLLDAGVPFCLTLEREWADNEPDVSCIPVGSYRCLRTTSPKFGPTFEVTGVPNRSAILFHKGNLLADTHGCVILGEQYEPLDGKSAVISSGEAMAEFLARTDGLDEFALEVQDA